MIFKNRKNKTESKTFSILYVIFKPLNFFDKIFGKTFSRIIKHFIIAMFFTYILYSLLCAIIVFSKMPNNTMIETIKKGDIVTVNKLSYAITIKPFVSKLTGKTVVFNTPKRGDIVFLKDPASKEERFIGSFFNSIISFFTFGIIDSSKNKYLVKRIIALPNETVEIKNKSIYINGEEINEPWNKTNLDTRILDQSVSSRDNFGPYIVKYNEYFVLSDNRDYGYDSRNFLAVPFGLIKGKVVSK